MRRPAADGGIEVEAARLARFYGRFAPHLAEDLQAEAVLALIETGGDTAAAAKRLDAIVNAEARKAARERQPGDHGRFEGLTPADRSTAAASARPPRRLTPGQKRRARRNLVIAAAARQGCSQRHLAEVFGLPRSRIGEIVKEISTGRIGRRAEAP